MTSLFESKKLFRLFNIDFYFHWSLLFLLMFGFKLAIIIMVSIFFHELAHTLVARKYNLSKDKINFNFLFGGAAMKKDIIKITPIKRLKIAIAGPVSHLFLIIISFIVALFSPEIFLNFISEFIVLNFMFFFLNLLPILPLDGFHVLTSILQVKTKKYLSISLIVSIISCIIAIILSLIFGLYFAALISVGFLYYSYKKYKNFKSF